MARTIRMMRITLRIRAGAKRTAFAGKLGDVWMLHVAAPPVDGKANDGITKFLAKLTRPAIRLGSHRQRVHFPSEGRSKSTA
jgi:uncharacterized protein YggU (UPF0235/DUF167 family)